MTGERGPAVVATGRQQGKSILATAWLMQGWQINTYPGWSRVLVCTRRERVPATADLMPHGPWRKCVFSLDDLRSTLRGAIQAGTVEFAFDDIEVLVMEALRDRGIFNVFPRLVTLTGHSVVDPDTLTRPVGYDITPRE